MFEDLVIISVDECNIRSDKLGGRSWKFNSRVSTRVKKVSQRKLRHTFSRHATLFNTHDKVLELEDASECEDIKGGE